MENEQRNETNVSANPTERIGGNVPGVANAQSPNAAPVPPAASPDFTGSAKHRKERIKKLEARLQREIARGQRRHPQGAQRSTLRMGRDGRGRIRDGDAGKWEQLRKWTKRKLTDHRHLKRAESGFTHTRDEAAENAAAIR